LVGEEGDLRRCALAIRGTWWVTEENGEFYLGSDRLKKLGHAKEVKRLADEFVELVHLQMLARSERRGSVCTSAVFRIHSGGSRDTTVFLDTGRLTIKGGDVEFSTCDGSAPSAPDGMADISVLKQRPRLATAYRHLNAELNWTGYWKATEALGEDIGGVGNIISHGWATEDEFKRFEQTIHHHRHHRVPAPPNQMSDGEARSALFGWLRKCLDWRRSTGP
jgi:hypothetical protein